jgi:hypothetical protein
VSEGRSLLNRSFAQHKVSRGNGASREWISRARPVYGVPSFRWPGLGAAMGVPAWLPLASNGVSGETAIPCERAGALARVITSAAVRALAQPLRPVLIRHGSPAGSALHEPFARAPLVLSDQHTSELAELVGAILERAEDRLAVRDRESNDAPVSVVSPFERFGRIRQLGLAKHARELEHERIRHRDSREHHERDYMLLIEQVFVSEPT